MIKHHSLLLRVLLLFYLFYIPLPTRCSNLCPCIWVTLEYDGRDNIRDEFNGAKFSDEFGNDSKYGG